MRADEKALNLLVQNLSGLAERDVRQLARNAIFDDGAITESDLPQIAKAKYALISQQGVLSFEYDTTRSAEVAGMARFKSSLEQRKTVFAGSGTEAPLDPPRGVLLLIVQGGGKSLAAKATAGDHARTHGFPALLGRRADGQRRLRAFAQTAHAFLPLHHCGTGKVYTTVVLGCRIIANSLWR